MQAKKASQRVTRPTTAKLRRPQEFDENCVLETPPTKGEIREDAPYVKPNKDAPEMLAKITANERRGIEIPMSDLHLISDEQMKDTIKECMRQMTQVTSDSNIANFENLTIDQRMSMFLGKDGANIPQDAGEKMDRRLFSLNRSFYSSLRPDDERIWHGVIKIGLVDVNFKVEVQAKDRSNHHVLVSCQLSRFLPDV